MKRAIPIVALAAIITASMTGAQAGEPEPRSQFLTSWCTGGNTSSIAGQGASFAKRAHLDAFIPAFNDNCPSGAGKVSYTSSGSGKGKSAACRRSSSDQFGGTDDALTTDEYARYSADLGAEQASGAPACPGHVPPQASPLHHIPIAIGGVTASYNLGSCNIGNLELNLSSTALGGVFAGLVTSWGDPLITQTNSQLSASKRTCLANKAIRPVVRLDGSGTTWIWKDYLSKRNPVYVAYKDPRKNQDWPATDAFGPSAVLRGDKNEGVAAVVKATDGALGYVEFAAAEFAGLTMAKIDNPAGQFVAPNPSTFEQASLGLVAQTPPSTLLPGWDLVSVGDSVQGYPASGLTYLLVYNNLGSAFGSAMTAGQAQRLVDYLGVILDPRPGFGQSRLNAAGYGRLPDTVRTVAINGVLTIQF